MFSKPQGGWSLLEVGDFKFPMSYTTDVPNDFLDALITAIKHNVNTFVTVDGESEGECEILFNIHRNTVCALKFPDGLLERVEYEFYTTSVFSFAEEFLKDLEENFDSWSKWWGFEEEGSKYHIPKEKIDELHQLLLHTKE